VFVIAASLAALAAFTALGTYVFNGGTVAMGGAGSPDSGTLAVVFVAVLAAVVGAAIVAAVTRGAQAAKARAEAQRDSAVERAQLLAAAMDPEIAMRILGYNGDDERPPR
jgi:uncharacterized Fe-S cluster-containing radical SAM superfamily enzyme